MQKKSQVLELINKVRNNPLLLLKNLEQMLPKFKGKIYRPSPFCKKKTTKEGINAVIEAINHLKTQKSVPSLNESFGIQLAAEIHCKDIGITGDNSHKGQNGSKLNNRIENFGDFKGKSAENLIFNYFHPIEIVLQQLIDDGFPDRERRNNIFNPDFKFIGIMCGEHGVFKHCCVVVFCEEFLDSEEKIGKYFRPKNNKKMRLNGHGHKGIFDKVRKNKR